MEFWYRAAVAIAVIVVSAVLAKLVDRRMARRQLRPEVVTRYVVLRRSIMAAIITIGVLSALLTLPTARTVAGAVLGSAAVVGLVVGFAAQTTLSNFVAGVLIAFTQPLRIGDRIEVGGSAGVVEAIDLMYTFIRLDDGSRLVIPNAKLATDTIRNASIVSQEKVAEITVQVPLTQELRPVLDALRSETAGERDPEVFVSALDGTATVTVRATAPAQPDADLLSRELRLRAHERLRAEGLLG